MVMAEKTEKKINENLIEGRNVVLESMRAGQTIDKLYIQENLTDYTIKTVIREAKKHDIIFNFVSKERMDWLSSTGKHQGVIAITAAFEYSSVEEILRRADEKNEPPFIFLLDGIEDPHNLGAIIRAANVLGAHGVIIPKHRAAGLTGVSVRASAGAISHTPVAKVTNIAKTIEELKEKGLWFVCADMSGEEMYSQNLSGAIGLVIGNEGSGVSENVRGKCDFITKIPMRGEINSLNASVAAGVLGYEVFRQKSLRGEF